MALFVAQQIERAPKLFRLMDFANAQGRRFGARLEQPGRLDAGHVFAEFVIVQHGAKFRDEKAHVARIGAHGQFVAITGGNADPHAGNAGVLPYCRRGLLVELVESARARATRFTDAEIIRSASSRPRRSPSPRNVRTADMSIWWNESAKTDP